MLHMDVPLFQSLGDSELRRVLAAAPRRRFPKGQAVCHAGDLGDSLFAIVRGRVAVRVDTEAGDTATLAVLGPGEFFGELALFTPQHRRTASVIALEPVEVLSLGREQLATLRHRHPDIDEALLGVMAREVQRLSAHLVEALFVPVEKRVMRRLVALCLQYGTGAAEIVVPLTQEDLAGLAGTTRPTVNQVLRRLEERGTVSLSRGRITVLDVETLTQRAR